VARGWGLGRHPAKNNRQIGDLFPLRLLQRQRGPELNDPADVESATLSRRSEFMALRAYWKKAS
jgi:hypothetical protein